MTDRFNRFVAGIGGRSHTAPETDFSLRRNEFMRFLVAGGVNTLFGFAAYSAFIMAGMEVWLALLAGTALGTIFNFFTTGGYAFRKLSFSRFPRFVICYLFVYGSNLILLRLISGWLNDKILSQAILVVPVALLAYFLMARFVFSEETSQGMKIPSARALIAPILLMAGIIAVLLAHAAYVYAPSDDAYIYLVYAKSFLEGKGLTFNGEAVQGFSSVLWPWLIVTMGALKIELPYAIQLLSFLSAIFVVIACYMIGTRLGLSRIQAAIPGAVLAFTGDFAFYAGNGLETLLFAAMVLVATSFLFHPEPKLVLSDKRLLISLFVLILARPEGLLVSLIIIVWLSYASKDRFAGMTLSLKLILFLFPVYLALKMAYGDWLPATYHVKSGAGLANLGQGIAYLVLFGKHYVLILLLLFLAFLLRWKKIGKAALPVCFLLLAWIAQVTIQGGDEMVGFRMYLPILPVAYLTIVYAFRDIPIKISSIIAAGVAAYLFFTYNFGTVIGGAWKASVLQQAGWWRNSYVARKATGLWLKDTFPDGTKVALSPAGTIPYFSGLPTIDMLGLNNRYIALHGTRDRSLPYGHQAGDGRYVLDNSPGVIFLVKGLQPGPFVSDREIWQDPRFKRNYAPCKATGSTWIWVRKDLISKIQEAGKTLACLPSQISLSMD